MFKYQKEDQVVIEDPNMRPIQAQVMDRMKSVTGSNWYKLMEIDTGNRVIWLEQNERGETRQVEWYPEKDLTPITHSLDKGNPNTTFKDEKLSSAKKTSYSQFVTIKRLLEETGGEIEGNVAEISYREAKEIIETLKELIKTQREIR